MSDEEKAKKKAPEAKEETKDERPLCVLCNQHVNPEILEDQDVKLKVKIPRSKWNLITAKQAAINRCDVAAEEVKVKIMEMTNKLARAHGITFMVGLGIEVEPPKGEDEVNNQWGFYTQDAVTQKKYYLGKKIDPEEQKILGDLWWDFGSKIEDTNRASLENFKTMVDVAEMMGWGFRPIRVDQGHFIADSRIKEMEKAAEERGKKKAEEEYKKKQG